MGNGILYIIGNGFDLFHGLKSSYKDYSEFAKINTPNVEEFLEVYFPQKNKDDWWSHFEENFENFDARQFYDDHDNISEGFMEQEHPQWSDYFGVLDEINEESEKMRLEIKQSFWDWINEISKTEIERKNMHFEEDVLFLSFNYTSTLEKVYNIPNVFHIHGYIGDSNEESLVFGYRDEDETPKIDENEESNRTPSSDAEAASHSLLYQFRKPVKDIIARNQCFFESLRCIKKVVVLGHSLNQIDKPYFDKIKNITSTECKWTIVYLKDADGENKIKAISAMKNLGISDQQYELLPWDKYVHQNF